jgi:Rne/Rng family ribonuclease
MSKELYVSSTPHETKVGVVEDDLLAEIYLERENEYTLAGSIYKGRVTRVLPGMQSAFVDIGLERDAFLYVSDFMELADQEEVDEIPTNRPAQDAERDSEKNEPYHPAETRSILADSAPTENPGDDSSAEGNLVAAPAENREVRGDQDEKDNRGGFRGRRRRRGRRGERMPDSKFARPGSERTAPERSASEAANDAPRPERSFERTPERTERPQRSEYGPPPGYQPILLPGESISKYKGLGQAQSSRQQSSRQYSSNPAREEAIPPIAKTFPEDEPLFSETKIAETNLSETKFGAADNSRNASASGSASFQEIPIESPSGQFEEATLDIASSEWDREQKRLHEMNVAAVFGEASEPMVEQPRTSAYERAQETLSATPAGTMEEEEIEEEEADLTDYVEDLEEDAAFEEMEEETSEVGDQNSQATQQIAAAADPSQEPFSASETVETEVPEAEAASEAEHDQKEAVEAEIEEAQAEAEAILDAEARGDGTVNARAEVRASSAAAPYTQRATRPSYDRNNQRGRRSGGKHFRRREPQNVPLISDLLKEGQEILVQIAKEPIGKKGARITSHIALPGRFLVYMPTVNHTGVSRKISSEEERQRLKRIIISERENGHGGFIVRTAAQGAAEEDLRADIRFLKGLWAEIKTRAENGKSPTLIYHDLNVVERVLRDQVSSDFSAIWVDTEQEYERILRFANRFQPGLVRRVKLYTKEVPLYEQFGLTEEINKALKSKVWLKSGGYIVINQTEALVAIDVNTGKYVGKTQRLEDTIVKTNVDAIKEIVRQIRLRDLGGIIIIDFIDMDERRNRQKVMQALEEALRSDRAPSKVLQFNDFGLVAITRKRVKQSLERTIGSPCPYCESTGFVKSIPTVCNDIYIEMRKMAKHLDHADAMLRVNPEVAKALKANNGKALAEMEELIKKTVIVKSDPALHQEQFDIN